MLVTKNIDGTFTIEKEGFKPINTKHYLELDDETYDYLLKKFTDKPDMKYVIYDINSLVSGSTVYPNIKKYYFFDLQAKTQIYKTRYTIEEIFNDRELLSIFYAKTKTGSNFFTSDDAYENILSIIRTAGGGLTGKPASFPIKVVDEILHKYNINNNYYDFSCGWGDRMLSSIRNGINYFGTDPNYILCDRLNLLKSDYERYSLKKLPIVEINCQGSETFIPRYYNSIGVAFSSPPYFCLEDYKIGNQSYTDNVSYEFWINDFMRHTMENIYDYLVENGHYCLCIKNFDKYKLEEDSVKLAESVGFKLVKVDTCNMIHRVSCTGNSIKSDENIFVFKKDLANKHYHVIDDTVETVSKYSNTVVKVKNKKLF